MMSLRVECWEVGAGIAVAVAPMDRASVPSSYDPCGLRTVMQDQSYAIERSTRVVRSGEDTPDLIAVRE